MIEGKIRKVYWNESTNSTLKNAAKCWKRHLALKCLLICKNERTVIYKEFLLKSWPKLVGTLYKYIFENSYHPSDLKCKHWIGNTVNTGAILRCWCGWWKEWVNERTLDEMTIDRSFPSTEALVRLYYLCWCYWKESPIDREMLDHLHAKDFPNTCWWQLQQKATRQALLITLQLTKTLLG